MSITSFNSDASKYYGDFGGTPQGLVSGINALAGSSGSVINFNTLYKAVNSSSGQQHNDLLQLENDLLGINSPNTNTNIEISGSQFILCDGNGNPVSGGSSSGPSSASSGAGAFSGAPFSITDISGNLNVDSSKL